MKSLAKTLLPLTFLLSVFLSGCAQQTVKPASPVDWGQVQEHLQQLARPTDVYGPIKFRDQAETGMDLWTLSGNQTFALEEANGDKVRMLNYVKDVAAKAQEVEQPPCRFWQFACKRKKRAASP